MNKTKKKEILFLALFCVCFMLVVICTGLHIQFNQTESRGEKVIFTDDYGNRIFNKIYSGTNNLGVMIFHGFGEDQNSMKGYTIEFNRRGYNVFATDFFGHGRSSGSFISDNTTDDILANQVLLAKEEFKKITNLNDSQIYMVGHSFGARAILRASMIDSYIVGGLVLIGPAIHLLSQDFFENNWTQNLSSTNPNTNITIISGRLDDICPPAETRALFQKLSNETEFGDRYITDLPSGNQRGILIIDGLMHTYEVNAPYAIKDCVANIMYLRGVFYSPNLPQDILLKQRLRHSMWIFIPIFMLPACIFGFLFFEYRKFNPRTQVINENKSLNIENSLMIYNLKRYFSFKVLIAFLSLVVGTIPILLILLIPIDVPLFSLAYPIAIIGYGIIMILLLRYNKIPGVKGRLIIDLNSFKKNESKRLLLTIGLSVVFASIAVYFFKSEWYHIFPGNIRLLWLLAFTVFSSIGFYIKRIESEIIRFSFPEKLGMQIINNILFLIPLFLITIGIAASGLFFIFFEILHGFILLVLVQIFGGIIHKLCKNKFVTAIIQAFILMLIVIPKGPMVSIFW